MKITRLNKEIDRDILLNGLVYSLFLTILVFLLYHYLFNIRPWLNALEFNIGYKPASPLFPADTYYYWNFATFKSLFEIPKNVFGPVLFLKLFQVNPDVVFITNFSLLLGSIYLFSKSLKQDFFKVAVFILINPIIFCQIFYANKEIYMLISSFFLISSIPLQSKSILALGILISLFTKIEFIVIVVAWIFLQKLNSKYWVVLLVLTLAGLSIGYNHIPGIADKLGVLIAGQSNKSLGFTILMHRLASEYYLYTIIAFPRIALSTLCSVIEFLRAPSTIYIEYPSIISGIVFTYFSLHILRFSDYKKLLPEHLFLAIWFITVATIPFALHRYLIPCYPFLFSLYFKLKTKHEIQC